MRLLICAPFYSEGSNALPLVSALLRLHHEVFVWDYRNSPPLVMSELRYDVALVWGTEGLSPNLRRDKKNFLIFPDDDHFWLEHDKNRSLSVVLRGYDKFFTVNKIPGFEDNWLPMGAMLDVLFPIEMEKRFDCVFVGTNRDKRRENFVIELGRGLRNAGLSFGVFGNGWRGLPWWSGSPEYFSGLNRVLNSSRVVINQHYDLSTSTKDHELACCGSAVYLSDDKEAVKECYPDLITFSDADDAIEKVIASRGWEERMVRSYVKRLRDASKQFSYERQLDKLLKSIVD